MNPARAAAVCTLCTLLAGTGCKENPIVPEPNKVPTANARVVGPTGPIDETVDGGVEALKFAFDGTTPVDITLDGSGSSDADGKIVKYQWHSSTLVPDGGLPTATGGHELRFVPDPNGDPGWPPDEVQPHIQLAQQGVFSFSLWVVDDKGAISKPDTVKVTIGQAVDPEVAACTANVSTNVQPACAACICGIDAMCRTAVVKSACDDTCWGLINCIAAKCPNFAAMAAAMPPDFSCVTGMCMEFIGGATPARAAGACATMCPDDCRPAM